jgi:SPX domain protein involved in polyphosphate accumulation
VNNLYLDTPWMTHYLDNLNGALERMKVRVRWYHDLVGPVAEPVLEFKVKRGLVGWKESYSFPAFEFGSGLAAPALRRLIRGSPLPPEIKDHLANHRLALINRYRREYYVSQDGRFRVTIDSELTYFRAMPLASALVARGVDHGVVIVELKYDQPHERGADRVASLFPFRVTRSSKYVRGVEWFGAYAS